MTCILPGDLGLLASVAGGSTWDPANSSAMVLTNGNRTATGSSTTQVGDVRGVKSRNSGKYYFEVTVNATNSMSFSSAVGVCTAAYPVGAGDALGRSDSGQSIGLGFNDGTGVSEIWYLNQEVWSGSQAIVIGNVIGVAVDNTGAEESNVVLMFTVNGNNVGIAGFYGMSIVPVGTAVFPAFSGYDPPQEQRTSPPDQVTLTTGGPFVFGPPSGYLPWG